MPIRIRDLERKLFSYLFINKVATSSQLQRDIYVGITHQAVYKRLNRLIGERYLEADYHRELGGRLAYSLSLKAMSDFIVAKSSKEFRKQLKSNSVTHDLDLLDVRSRLKNLKFVEAYYSENLMRSDTELLDSESLKSLKAFNFDAVVKIKKANNFHFLPLEYERTLKFSNRYKTYFKKIYASNIEALLFVAKDDRLLQKVKAFEQIAIGNLRPKTFYSTLNGVTCSEGPVVFFNLKQERITLE